MMTTNLQKEESNNAIIVTPINERLIHAKNQLGL